MDSLIVGVAQVSIYIRHARSSKDKRQVVKSIEQKLRNQGFSVTECAQEENPKRASIGFAYVGHDVSTVEYILDEAFRIFVGDFEVVDREQDVFNYADLKENEPWDLNLEDDEFSKS